MQPAALVSDLRLAARALQRTPGFAATAVLMLGLATGALAGLFGVADRDFVVVLGSLLFGVSPLDPVTFGGMTLAMLAVGAIASYLPARRAARLDPMVSLRRE